MPSADWSQLWERFDEALALDEAERAGFLAALRAAHPDLAAELEPLLASHRQSGGVLDRQQPLDGLIPLSEEIPLGASIGPYRLVRRLGEGGMGVVFEAEQDEPIRRSVALKQIKPGMDTREVLARFAGERSALALMDHPHIARVLDAGSSADGRPYFVMELVRGASITRYADERRLTIRERLALMIPVCRAVQHAHQKGIIHRDLKPSNILVVETEGQAIPKVIDFGIAKAMEESSSVATRLTRQDRWLGTPEYMSPEQYDPARDIDTRTDVYSLGVVLYELLVGALPLAAERFAAASAEEARRILREDEPPSPSTRVSRASLASSDLAGRRRTDPATLRRDLRGEIDWIVLKALEKEPAQRYATAQELANDIERWLEDLPIQAGPKTHRYRVRKFVQRHRAWVGAVVVTFVFLAGFASWTAWQNRRIALALHDAEAQRERAEQVSRFLVDLFALSDPVAMKGETVTARQLLDQRAQRVDHDLADQPELRAELLRTMAGAYQNLGLYGETAAQLQRALSLQREMFGANNLAVAETESRLGGLELDRGRSADAMPHLEAAMAVRRAQLGPDHPATLETALRIGVAHREAGRYDVAVTALRDTRDRALRADLGEKRDLPMQVHGQLAATLLRAGRLEEAAAEFEQALALPEAQLESPQRADLLNNYGAMLLERGERGRAEPLFREALALRRELLGERNVRTVSTMSNLALLLHQTQRHDEAEALYRQVLARQREINGTQHPRVALALHNLALLLSDRGQPSEAEPLVREALAMQRAVSGPQHPNVAFHLTLWGGILAQQRRWPEAGAALEEGLALRRARLPLEHPDLAASLHALGELRLKRGLEREAEPLLSEALAIREKAYKADDSRTVATRRLLERCRSRHASPRVAR